jgi:hypothetical protein
MNDKNVKQITLRGQLLNFRDEKNVPDISSATVQGSGRFETSIQNSVTNHAVLFKIDFFCS